MNSTGNRNGALWYCLRFTTLNTLLIERANSLQETSHQSSLRRAPSVYLSLSPVLRMMAHDSGHFSDIIAPARQFSESTGKPGV